MFRFLLNLLISSFVIYLTQKLWYIIYSMNPNLFSYSTQNALYFAQVGITFYAVMKSVFNEFIWESNDDKETSR
jgi:hypothetical protein